MPIPKNSKPKSELKRKAIVDAATTLFLEQGYQATSMNQIVAMVGGSKGTIYNHFKNKEALFLELAQDSVQEHLKLLHEKDLSGLSLRDALIIVADDVLLSLGSDHGIDLQLLIYSEAKRLPKLGEVFYQQGTQIAFNELEKYFDQQKKLGHFNCKDTSKAAEYFFGMLMFKYMRQRFSRVVKQLSKAQRHQQVSVIVDDFLELFHRN